MYIFQVLTETVFEIFLLTEADSDLPPKVKCVGDPKWGKDISEHRAHANGELENEGKHTTRSVHQTIQKINFR